MSDLGLSPETDAEGFPVMSPGLRRVLTEGDSAWSASRLISINATLYAEARELAPTLDRALAPLEFRGLYGLLAEHAPDFGVVVPQADPEVFWNAYLRELQTVPLSAVAQAMRLWKRPEMHTGKFAGRHEIFPTPAELLALARPHMNTLGQMRHRVHKALEMAAATKPVVRERMTRAEMIAAGYLNPDGTANLTKSMPAAEAKRQPVTPSDDLGTIL